jgi:FixJ family two-component response regulator
MHSEIGAISCKRQSSLMTKEAQLDAALKKETVIVCLLDDDPSVLKATGRLLSSAGWKVECFLDPIIFLKYAETHRPEIAVLDILMPVMNGLQVQTRLQTISPSTRVIILTSKDDLGVRSKAMDLGASGFFVKPVHDEELLEGIRAAISEN